MAFLSGENITAGRLNRLQPSVYQGAGTGDLAAGQTNAAVPGCGFNASVGVPSALYEATIAVSFYNSAASAGLGSCRLYVDGVGVGIFGIFQSAGASDKATVAQTYAGVLTSAGDHTFEVRASTGTGVTVKGVYSTLLVKILEPV